MNARWRDMLRRSPLWIYDSGDLAKIGPWLAARPDITHHRLIEYRDTGALCIACFAGTEERGIIRVSAALDLDRVLEIVETAAPQPLPDIIEWRDE